MLPVILLAFANDKEKSGPGYLRGLTRERNGIRDALLKAESNGLCQVLVEPDVTVDRIFDIFQNPLYRDRIGIFHYGGHAESYALLLESASGGHATAHSEGLVGFLSKQKSLKLVFLNGCSSQKQSEDLVEAGIPAVIGTSQDIRDEIATGLSTRFYKGIAAGMNIERVWTDAIDQIKTETGSNNSKALFAESILGSPGEDAFPWKLYTGEGGEISKAWNLPEAANQPLFGLELPNTYYRKLPLAPYPGLRSFSREEAAVFFGRGAEIRRIYTQLSREQPLIILSGKKGTGKTSLLDAGLIPRLESNYVVKNIQVHTQDATESLITALQQSLDSHQLGNPIQVTTDVENKAAELRAFISTASGFAKDILVNELARLTELAGRNQLSLSEQWKSIEHKSGLPLLMVLDEVNGDHHSIKIFIETIAGIFENNNPPLGKLIIVLCEDARDLYLEVLHTAKFPYAEIFLQPLTWEGIQESITGISNIPSTKDHYHLQIEDSNATNFPSALASDLHEGDPTLVAPYLQLYLSQFWTTAIRENQQAPAVTYRTYQKASQSGEIPDQFLTAQLEKLKSWNTDVVNSGLALDILYQHTSAIGKSNFLPAVQRNEFFNYKNLLVRVVVTNCKELFLLTGNITSGTDLGHNLLAMVVIRQYSASLNPGQQASRILNSITPDQNDSGFSSWLNEKDLETVEQGIVGMRSLTPTEKSYVDYSRAKKQQADQDKKRNKIIRLSLVSIVVAFAALAVWQWHLANERYQYSRAGELAFTAREMMGKDNTIALGIASKAYELLHEDSPPLVMQTLSEIFHTQDVIPFYSANFPHKEKVFSAEFSPDGKQVLTASEDGFVKVWDLNGKELLSIPHEIEVTKAIFTPTDKQILTLTRTHVSLWELDGRLTDRDSISETTTNLDVYTSDGMKILATNPAATGNYSIVVAGLKREENSVVTSPAENRIITIQNGLCQLFDQNGLRLIDSMPRIITSAAFAKDGKRFLTISPESDYSRINVWNESGDSLFAFPCKGTEVSAVFSPEGTSILTASNDFTAKRWNTSSPYLHQFRKQSQAVNTIDYYAENKRYVTTSFDSTAKVWDNEGHLLDSLKHGDIVTSAIFSPDGNQIITASRDSTARLWNPKERSMVVLRHQNEVTSSTFSHDGKFILTTSLDSSARIWNKDGSLATSIRLNGDATTGIFATDDKSLLTISSDQKAILWDLKGKMLFILKHSAKIYSAVFSPYGHKILTTCADSIVRQWSYEGELMLTMPHFDKPRIAIFTPDGNHIITGGKLVKIWSIDGTLQDSLVHAENITALDVSPDSKNILTTSIDHRAYLWNNAGELIANYQKHSAKINFGMFTSDGNHILTVADDGKIFRWKTPWAIYNELKVNPVYILSPKELEEFGIVR
ncbi:MAG: hypothetical protein M3R25_01680 [Bacteroidota bacterium]|nr:hypothetical protein [Bacteroidota bacterium]